jgi:hypothetical protein
VKKTTRAERVSWADYPREVRPWEGVERFKLCWR